MRITCGSRVVEIAEPTHSQWRELLGVATLHHQTIMRYERAYKAGAAMMLQTLESQRGARREQMYFEEKNA